MAPYPCHLKKYFSKLGLDRNPYASLLATVLVIHSRQQIYRVPALSQSMLFPPLIGGRREWWWWRGGALLDLKPE